MSKKSLTAKVRKLTFWRATLPVLAIVIVNTMASPINTFIASGTSSTGVESVGTAGSVMMMFGVMLSLLSGGGGILIGQYIGKKRKENDLKEMTDSAFMLSLIQAIFLGVLVFFLSPLLLKAWGVQDGTSQMTDGDLYIKCLAPTWLLISLQGYFMSTTSIYGYPNWSMIVGIGITILDTLVSSLLVYLGNYGVIGVILGTVIARSMGFIFSIIVYSQLVQPFWRIRKFTWKATKKLMGISVPIAGEKINYNLAQFIQGIIIGNIAAQIGMVVLGHNYMLWSRAIFLSISAITLIGGVAFSIGLERIMSRLLGEGKVKEAKILVRKAFLFAWLLDMSLVGIVVLIRNPMIDFLTMKTETAEEVTLLKNDLFSSFFVLFLLETGRVMNLIYIGATRSAGDTKFTAIASVPITWATAILVSWLLAFYTDLKWLGVVIGMALDEFLRGILNYGRYKSNAWLKHLKKAHSG